MTDEKKSHVKSFVENFFWVITDFENTHKLTNAIIDDVIKDIEETANENFNNCDIDIAITRVLKRKLNIEE